MGVPEVLAVTGEPERDRLAARLAREYIVGHIGEALLRARAGIRHLHSNDVEGRAVTDHLPGAVLSRALSTRAK